MIKEWLVRDGLLLGLSGLILCPVVGYMMWQSSRDELAMIDHAKVVPATLVDVGIASHDPRDGDGGAEGRYTYRMLDGKEGTIDKTYDSVDQVPGYENDEILEVEYLPEKPEVKRVKGTGSSSTGEFRFWLGFKCLLLLIWFVVSGAFFVGAVRNG
jgi:hypothetical protein